MSRSQSEQRLWWTWGLLMIATLGASGLERFLPTGPAEQVNLYDADWELVVGDVNIVDGVATVTAGPEERVEWWHPITPPGSGPWQLETRARVRVDGDPIRAVLRSADGLEPVVWVGTPRLTAGEWVTTRRQVSDASATRPLQIGVVATGPAAAVDIAWLRLVQVRASRLFWGTVFLGALAWAVFAGIVARRVVVRFGRAAWWGMAGVSMLALGALLPLAVLRGAGIAAAVQTGAHGVGFGILGVALGSLGAGPAAVVRLAALGASLEALQGLLLSRSANLEDVAYDTVGAALGWSLGAAMHSRRSSER